MSSQMRATASYPPTSPQDQYVFIHDALNDFLTCGDTSVPAHELRRTISTMSQADGDGETGFQRQFEVGPYVLYCDISGHTVYSVVFVGYIVGRQ